MVTQQVIEVSTLNKIKDFCKEQIDLINQSLENDNWTSDNDTQKVVSKLKGMKKAFSEVLKVINGDKE